MNLKLVGNTYKLATQKSRLKNAVLTVLETNKRAGDPIEVLKCIECLQKY